MLYVYIVQHKNKKILCIQRLLDLKLYTSNASNSIFEEKLQKQSFRVTVLFSLVIRSKHLNIHDQFI